jgi:hypothetical protein
VKARRKASPSATIVRRQPEGKKPKENAILRKTITEEKAKRQIKM